MDKHQHGVAGNVAHYEKEEAADWQEAGGNKQALIDEINRLRKEKNAIILAHYYQHGDVQDIADFVGDSLGLSQQAASTSADVIVFAGVYFMAETAKILNPAKKVLLPDLNSGCSLADSCTADQLQEMKTRFPEHIVVSYVNCSAEVKALSDIVCTSANAEKIINSIPVYRDILFVPDRNLGNYLIRKTGREMKLWEGSCVVHEAFSVEKLITLHREHPEAVIIAHPESESHILRVASYVGSTAGMIEYVRKSTHHSFIVATEAGILHQMQQVARNKKLIAAPVYGDSTCACSECAFMRLTTLDKVYRCLRFGLPEITVPETIAKKAVVPIQKMLDLSA